MDGYLVEIGSSDQNAWIFNFIRKGYLYDLGKKTKADIKCNNYFLGKNCLL